MAFVSLAAAGYVFAQPLNAVRQVNREKLFQGGKFFVSQKHIFVFAMLVLDWIFYNLRGRGGRVCASYTYSYIYISISIPSIMG